MDIQDHGGMMSAPDTALHGTVVDGSVRRDSNHAKARTPRRLGRPRGLAAEEVGASPVYLQRQMSSWQPHGLGVVAAEGRYQ